MARRYFTETGYEMTQAEAAEVVRQANKACAREGKVDPMAGILAYERVRLEVERAIEARGASRKAGRKV